METFRDIINLWPSAEDLGRDIDIPGGLVRLWRRRDNIPAAYWLDIVTAAATRSEPILGVTLKRLATLAKVREAA